MAMTAHTPDPNTQEAEAKGLGVQGHHWLYSRSEANVKSCIRKKKSQKKEEKRKETPGPAFSGP